MSKIFKAFQEKKEAIRRTVGKYRPNHADIEELTQETFLKAFAAEQTQEIHQPENFLLTVAKRVAISAAQKKITSSTNSVEDSGGIAVFADERQVSADDQLDARQKLFVMSQAIASLPPELSRAFMMRRVEGLRYKQIATRLNISVSLVEKRVANAMVDCVLFLRKNGYDPVDFGVHSRTSKRSAKAAPLSSQRQETPDDVKS